MLGKIIFQHDLKKIFPNTYGNFTNFTASSTCGKYIHTSVVINNREKNSKTTFNSEMTLNTSVVISFLFSEGIIVATVRNRNEEKSSHFLSYFFRIQFHNTKYKKIGSRIFFEKMKLSRDHHPYLACVSAFVRKPFERRS